MPEEKIKRWVLGYLILGKNLSGDSEKWRRQFDFGENLSGVVENLGNLV